jgi:hypothetical protein
MRKAALIALMALGPTWAGSSADHAARIDRLGRRASGIVVSSDSQEPIGCRVMSALGMEAAQCYARDAAGATAECSTQDGDLIAAAAAARQKGFLTFTWDEDGQCASIELRPRSAPSM